MGAMLMPIHLSGNKAEQDTGSAHRSASAGVGSNLQVPEQERDVMDDLVDQLAALDSKSSGEL
jgi:hypothetical protein